MALFDFLRRGRRPASGESGRRGLLGRIINRFIHPSPEPEQPEPEEFSQEEPPTGLDIVDLDEINEDSSQYGADAMGSAADGGYIPAGVTDLSDEELLNKYGKMIDTMVERGYITQFDSDQGAAEFLRVLSSQAWEEAHGYWYSVEALSQIQDAIARGATAGTLQSNYNNQIEKKSNHYLETWEDWLNA